MKRGKIKREIYFIVGLAAILAIVRTIFNFIEYKNGYEIEEYGIYIKNIFDIIIISFFYLLSNFIFLTIIWGIVNLIRQFIRFTIRKRPSERESYSYTNSFKAYSIIEEDKKKFVLLSIIPAFILVIIVLIRDIIYYVNGYKRTYGILVYGDAWYEVVKNFLFVFGGLSIAFLAFWLLIDFLQIGIRFFLNRNEKRKEKFSFIIFFLIMLLWSHC